MQDTRLTQGPELPVMLGVLLWGFPIPEARGGRGLVPGSDAEAPVLPRRGLTLHGECWRGGLDTVGVPRRWMEAAELPLLFCPKGGLFNP